MKRHERGFLDHEPDFQKQQEVMMLEQCAAALFGGLRGQLETGAFVGGQLAKIRENQLFRAAGCETFEHYRRKFLSMTSGQVRRLMQLHEVVETIRAANLELPVTETQALLLAKIPRSRLIYFWREVIAYCLRTERALSDGIVRRAIRFKIASEKLASPSERIAQKRTEKSRVGVEVTLDFD